MDHSKIIKQHIEAAVKTNKYIYLTYRKISDGPLYEIPFRCRSSAKFTKDNEITLYNCISNKNETISSDDIDHITVIHMNCDDHVDHNKEVIDDLKIMSKLHRHQHTLDNRSIDVDLEAAFLEKFFLSHQGARMDIQYIYLLCKLDLYSMDELYELDLDTLKETWKDIIKEYQLVAIETINAEIQKELKAADEFMSTFPGIWQETWNDSGNTHLDADSGETYEELKIILELLDSITETSNTSIDKITTRHELFAYWPDLLLPSPFTIPGIPASSVWLHPEESVTHIA